MSELPEVRPTTCGHGGVVLADTPPDAQMQNGNHMAEMWLCEDCRSRLHRPKVEMKPAPALVTKGGQDSIATGAGGEVLDAFRTAAETRQDPHALGTVAALEGKTEEDNPHPDKRTREAKEWLRGFREAKAGG